MPVDVGAFSAMARQEFMQGKQAAENRVMPAAYDRFTTKIPSTTRVETHLYMSNLPRLREFKGYSPGQRLTVSPYTVENVEYRIGPVSVRKTDLDDDQIGGYLLTVKGLPEQGKKDIGYRTLDHLAAGASKPCFDGTNFIADSHTIGSGDNQMTADNAGNDGAAHKILALNLSNPTIKPIIFQDREALSELKDDSRDALSEKVKEIEYWADCRFGLAYGFWWDAVLLTITDTPTLPELQGHIKDIINRFRTFTLPKGADVDSTMKVHENWVPAPDNFLLLCNLQLAELLRTVQKSELIAAGTSGATVTNTYRDVFDYLPTSSLDS